MASPRYDEVVDLLRRTHAPAMVEVASGGASPVGTAPNRARTRDDAITEAGQLLLAAGAVDAAYLEAMHEREKSVSTHMGNGLSIPHGTNEAQSAIRRSALSFVRYDEPVDWKGKPTTFVIAIAGAGEEHLALLQKIAHVFLDKAKVAELQAATSPEQVQVQRILGA